MVVEMRELDKEETKQVFERFYNEPHLSVNYTKDSAEFFYRDGDKVYMFIYDRSGDWFCDIIFEFSYADYVEHFINT